MADIKQKFGSLQTLTVTGLNSLADDSYWQSDAFTLTDLPFDLLIFLALSTTTTAGNANGYARVFMATSNDGTIWSGDASGTQGAYNPATPSAAEQAKNLIPIGIVSMKADETTARVYEKLLSVLAAWKGAIPKYGSLIVHNKTATALASSGNVATVLPVYSQSV